MKIKRIAYICFQFLSKAYLFSFDSNSAKKVVFGTGIAMAICCAFSLERHVNQVWNGEGGPPLLIPIVFGLLALWSFYVSLKKDSSE